MGCDIHIIYQKQVDGIWINLPDEDEFSDRNYDLFAFLANVRNISRIEPISEPRGVLDDFKYTDDWDLGDHSESWLSIKELEEYDYTKVFKNFREGGVKQTIAEYLQTWYFEELQKMKVRGVERIVFGFDS